MGEEKEGDTWRLTPEMSPSNFEILKIVNVGFQNYSAAISAYIST